jgi:hypothetical protein
MASSRSIPFTLATDTLDAPSKYEFMPHRAKGMEIRMTSAQAIQPEARSLIAVSMV